MVDESLSVGGRGDVSMMDTVNGFADESLSVAGSGGVAVADSVADELGALNNNLPGSGWSLVTNQNFGTWEDPMADSWQDPVTGVYWSTATNREGENPSIVSDTTAPAGSNQLVWRQNYEGVRDGHEPMFPSTSLGGGLEFFLGYYVKFAATWTNPSTSGIKWHIPNAIQGGAGSQSAGWLGTGRESGGAGGTVDEPAMKWTFNGTCEEMTEAACGIEESPGAVRFQVRPALGTGLMTRGSWHKVQYYMNKGGTGNQGIVRIWLDDALIVDHTGFTWTDPAGTWQSIQLGATRGGAALWGSGSLTDLAPAGTIIHYDQFMIYSR